MSALVQTFRFRVELVNSSGEIATLIPPPKRGAGAAPPPAAPSRERLGDGGFSECSGLELDTDVGEYLEGARNDGVVRRVGRVKPAPIVLKRGLLTASVGGYADTALWDWLYGMVSGAVPVPRYDGSVKVLDAAGQNVVARWSFEAGLPVKVSGPSLNATGGEIAIEELHIAHEGLRLERTP